MTNILPIEPKQFVMLGKLVPYIYRCYGLVLCDFNGISELLNISLEKALKDAKEKNRVTTFQNQCYCTADDFAFWVDELPEAPLLAKQLAKRIHKTSDTEMAKYFLFERK